MELFAADALPSSRELKVVEHLERCDACRRRADSLGLSWVGDSRAQRTLGAGTDDDTHSEPADLRAELYQLVQGEVSPALLASDRATEIFRLLTASQADDVSGIRLGRYVIQRWLGAGGFGVVFLARDEQRRRDVALKLPHAQSLARREVRRRFLREARASEAMNHPNIVPVDDAGEEKGLCYVASAYCPGPTLHSWIAEQSKPIAPRMAAALVRQLAEAVQHAHDHRVLHRDIKPTNVLMDLDPTRPGEWTPKITDFGLAKLLDSDASETGTHGVVGTPRYMSPEQASGDRSRTGPGTDIFALGAVLYELLVGTAPFAGRDSQETLHRLVHDRVVRPRRIRRDLPRDLEAICLKCIEKAIEDRYRTAQELADDLRRFESGKQVRGRSTDRVAKWCRSVARQPGAMTRRTAIVAGVLAWLVLMALHQQTSRVTPVKAEAVAGEKHGAVDAESERARSLLFASEVARAHRAIKENDWRQAHGLLAGVQQKSPDLAESFVWRYLWNQVNAPARVVQQGEAPIYDLRYSPGQRWLATSGADSVLRIYDAATFHLHREIDTNQDEINASDFAPDLRSIATAGDDGTVRLWDVATGRLQRVIEAHPEVAFSVRFISDGRLVTCGNEPTIRVWDLESGESLATLSGHEESVEAIAVSPDGGQLASASSDDTARVWDLQTFGCLSVLTGHEHAVNDIEFSASGDYLLTGSKDHSIRLWRAADARCLQIERHVDPVASVAFLKDDAVLISGDRGGVMHAWRRAEVDEGADVAANLLHRWKPHLGRVWNVAAAPDGLGVLSAGGDGRVLYRERLSTIDASLELQNGGQIDDVAFDETSTRLHYIDSVAGVQTWAFAGKTPSATATESAATDRPPRAMCLLPGKTMMTGFADGALEAIELTRRERLMRLVTSWKTAAATSIDDLAASRDGRRLAVFSYTRDATQVYDLVHQKLKATFQSYAHAMALCPEGKRLAMSDGDDLVVWDVDREQEFARLRGHSSTIQDLEFSPSGRWLTSASKDRHVRLWNLDGPHTCTILDGHRAEVQAIAHSPDGHLLASGDKRGVIKLWLLPDATELLSIEAPQAVRGLVFSPDGNRLAVQMADQLIILQAEQTSLREHFTTMAAR